jgi:hypothetical protein
MTRRAGFLIALLLTCGYFQMYTLQWVGVADPDMLRRAYHSHQTLEGVRLSPIADFLFLKNVHRSGSALTAGGAE